MARSVNIVHLVGNVGNDPEVRSTSTGKRTARISLATSRSWNNDSGEKQEKTEWHSLTVWGKLVDVVEQWVHKGDRLFITGRIEYSKTEKDGETKYYTNITVQDLVMLGSPKGGGRSEAYEPEEEDRPPVRKPEPARKKDPDEDLPF